MTDSSSTACPGIVLRARAQSDLEFLFSVYASSRADEMAQIIDWSEEQKDEFLRFQFKAQHTHYDEHYPDARYDVIVRDGRDIGRLYVDRMRDEIRLMDIALLPEFRNLGIGRALVQELLHEAAEAGKFVSLHVEENNPARRLYQRLGFADAGEVTFYKLMHWVPEGITPALATDGGSGTLGGGSGGTGNGPAETGSG